MSNSAIAIRMTAVSIFLKLLVYTLNWQFTTYEKIYFFINIFILMSGVFFGIYFFKKSQTSKSSFLEDIKAGMKVAALYAFFMTVFVFIYYRFIDEQYLIQKLENKLEVVRNSGQSAQNESNARKIGEVILSPFFQSTITLVGYLLLGSFYASIIAFFVRRIKGFSGN